MAAVTNKNKVLAHIEKYAVTYLFIALSILFVIASGLDINYVASQLLLRLNRNAFIVLALIIPIIAGMGINFAITIGAMAAQIGLLLNRNSRHFAGGCHHTSFGCLFRIPDR